MVYSIEQLTAEQLACGFVREEENERYVCIVCGAVYGEGEIYPFDERFFNAKQAVLRHVQTHGDRLEQLLDSGGRSIALTENQTALLRMLRKGLSDTEIASKTGVSPSTVRQQRFQFREKEKQAKMYLALYHLSLAGRSDASGLVPTHDGATMVDERYVLTKNESASILKNAFESTSPLILKVFPAKEKKKIVILTKISEQFEHGRTYSEKEINTALGSIYSDFATLRRYLIEYGFMERTPDCSRYWLK